MRVYGLDFTSAPRPRKPITRAACTLDSGLLRLERLDGLRSFGELAAFLDTPGPWIAGFDFPFGQPRKLVTGLGWPESWAGYVRAVERLGKEGFSEALAQYRSERPVGDRHHLRAVDGPAGALSPMMLFGVPVGKMFFEGAPRLLHSRARVLPFETPSPEHGIAVEAYPGLVARRWLGPRAGYKNDIRSKQTPAHAAARRALVAALRSDEAASYYGFGVVLSAEQLEDLVADPSGDRLDALLCAVQAAWAYERRATDYGIPADRADLAASIELEGWIVDPELMAPVGVD